MPIPAVITGAIVDVAKKFLFSAGKKVAHGFVDSATGKNLGQIICYRNNPEYNNVILFVHGFSGSAAETFGCTPDMLVKDHRFDGWNVFSIGYSSDIFPSIGKGLWSVNPDITKVAGYLNTLLENQFNDYERIGFVGHSMGGLAVQRAILDASDRVRQKISHVLFFGTPSAGLEKAYWFKFWNTQVHDLDYKSAFIVKLRADWTEMFTSNYSFVLKTIAGSKDEFVPVTSSLNPFDKILQGIIEGNHISMIKPKDENDIHQQSFEIILLTLTKVENQKGNPEELNILLGEYQSIINKYLPIAKDVGIREIKDLVFALEDTGRNQEALKALNEHPLSSTNSDLLGIIGGRYKRMYLLNGLQKDLDSAFDYYKKALAIAQGKQDEKQIFYHAINIAFLSLVANNDEPGMKKYAQISLDNCVSTEKDMWELATIAESNLYLGHIEPAKEYYIKAAQIAGSDVRAKQSIYSNAYYGYQSLTRTKNKNAEFIKMLGDLFLV